MEISSSTRASLTFLAAIILLGISGAGALLTIVKLHSNQYWVNHTYQVEVGLGDFESSLGSVGRARLAYLDAQTPKALADFQAAVQHVAVALANVKQLTNDNPAQQSLLIRLSANADHRVALSQESVRHEQQGQNTPANQQQLTFETGRAAIETSAIIEQMRANEDSLLRQRSQLSETLFKTVVGILILSFALSAIMFWIHYRLLDNELGERKAAENHLRELSVRLMKVQDEESRRFARELHDGLGQGLVAAKMVADSLVMQNPSDEKLSELMALLDDSVSATRTLSYLLHPPMLDEMGFASAANWFIDGYSRRTGIGVTTDISSESENLPSYLRLSLFRILQESLTNVHRHSKSAKADVRVSVGPREVSLTVRDFGRGIPAEKLARFNKDGASVGVGLAGMKERVAELKGKFVVHSDDSGTQISATVPLIAKQHELSTRSGATA